jgi:hypothetical protein
MIHVRAEAEKNSKNAAGRTKKQMALRESLISNFKFMGTSIKAQVETRVNKKSEQKK